MGWIPKGETKQGEDVRAVGLKESINYSSVRSTDALSYDTRTHFFRHL